MFLEGVVFCCWRGGDGSFFLLGLDPWGHGLAISLERLYASSFSDTGSENPDYHFASLGILAVWSNWVRAGFEVWIWCDCCIFLELTRCPDCQFLGSVNWIHEWIGLRL